MIAECPHEVPHAEPIGAARLRALLLRQPNFFFGDGGKLVETAEMASSACSGGNRDRHSVTTTTAVPAAMPAIASGTVRQSAMIIPFPAIEADKSIHNLPVRCLPPKLTSFPDPNFEWDHHR
jgi:hypothetical protein